MLLLLLLSACRTWEQCMARDPVLVAKRSNFTMETLGESLNGFFEKLTWKTIACLVVIGRLLQDAKNYCISLVFFIFSREFVRWSNNYMLMLIHTEKSM